MRTVKYFFIVLFLNFFATSNVASLERDFDSCALEEYPCCGLHQKSSNRLSLIREYLLLIPKSTSPRCYHVDCSQCHHVWCFEYEDYYYDEEEDEENLNIETHWTCDCGFNRSEDNFPLRWKKCRNFSIYPGYLSKEYVKYFSFFHDYLQYVDQNRSCNCFWPENSQKAANISNAAYQLFRNLFNSTELKRLKDDLELQKLFFIEIPENGFTLHGMIVNVICHSFFYSDYDWICRDTDFFSTTHFQENSSAEIKYKLDEIREQLALLFLDLYLECFQDHPNESIKEEIFLVSSFLNLWSLEEYDQYFSDLENNSSIDFIDDVFLFKNKKITSTHVIKDEKYLYYSKSSTVSKDPLNDIVLRPMSWRKSGLFLNEGVFYNDLSLYKDAIKVLTNAISLDPSNRNAYIERALAYFETNQIILALQDYQSAKKLTTVPSFILSKGVYIPQSKTEFSKGLVLGSTEGAKISTVEFVPSIFSCCRGILNGLWSFACSPIEVSQEMINTAYALGEFISSHSAEECLHSVVPELRELSLSWHKINDYSKGHKIGYIIGKYGVDIFAPVGVLKGMSKVRALKRANTMYTLEVCAASPTKQTIVLEESVKRASARAVLIESAKTGKIFVKNSNVQCHVMQPKHAWNRVLTLSGNVEFDFAKVVAMLEENNIMDNVFLKGKPQLFPRNASKIKKSEYEKIINSWKVHVEFETYLETGEMFLKDAWVVTK